MRQCARNGVFEHGQLSYSPVGTLSRRNADGTGSRQRARARHGVDECPCEMSSIIGALEPPFLVLCAEDFGDGVTIRVDEPRSNSP